MVVDGRCFLLVVKLDLLLVCLRVDLRGLALKSAAMSDSENEPEVKPALEWLSERYPDSPRSA